MDGDDDKAVGMVAGKAIFGAQEGGNPHVGLQKLPLVEKM